MSIRAAKFADVPALAGLLVEAHGRSVYAGTVVEVDPKEARALLVRSIQRHGGETCGSTLVLVAERDGMVSGVLLAVLDRILGIGTKLYATDVFFVCSPLVEAADPPAMLGAFSEWALRNPRVYEIVCGVTNVIGDPDRSGKLYERAGFARIGSIYRKGER